MQSNELLQTEEPRSVIADMAQKYGMERKAFESVMKQTVMPSKVTATNEEFVAFLSVAKEYNLNPLTKEIYAFPSKRGGVQPIVSIDGWVRIINEHPQLDGIEFNDVIDQGKVIAIECKISRKDRKHPVTATEYLAECDMGTDLWKKYPRRMLRHKALIQCARYAFGFSGIVDQDEAERIEESKNIKDITPHTEIVQEKVNLDTVPDQSEELFGGNNDK